MPPVRDLIDFLDDVLESDAFSDYGPNGLQVPSGREIETVVSGVTAHAQLLERALQEGADLVLVHHGLFWRGQPLEITPLMYRRLAPLFTRDVALAAYHLPLDGHPVHGNNALIAEGLGAIDRQPFARHESRPIGVRARFEGEGLSLAELVDRTRSLCAQEPLTIAGGDHRVRTIGIVSGAGTDYLHEALDLGLDAFLTGEPAERAYGIAVDAGIHFIAGGHHATETFGVKRLGELLAERFGVTHIHLDVRNPI